MVVQTSERRRSAGKPSRTTVRIASRPSRIAPATPASALQGAGQGAEQRLCALGVVAVPGLPQRPAGRGVQRLGQPVEDVARLVDRAALDRRIAPEDPADRHRQRLRPVDEEQPRHRGIEPALHQVVEQRLHHSGVLRRSLDRAARVLHAGAVDVDGRA